MRIWASLSAMAWRLVLIVLPTGVIFNGAYISPPVLVVYFYTFMRSCSYVILLGGHFRKVLIRIVQFYVFMVTVFLRFHGNCISV